MRVAMKLREQIRRFSGIFYPHFSKPEAGFIEEMVYGICAAKDVKLSEISRELNEGIELKETEERLSRHLGKEGLGEEVSRIIMREAAWDVGQETLIVVDMTDVKKSYAQSMEYLGWVRDGSSGELGKGYWMLVVLACEVSGRTVIPLHQRLWSAEAPDFVSENEQVMGAIEMVSEATEGRGIYVMDRGCDRGNLFKYLLERKLRFIVRLKGDRLLVYKGRKVPALALAHRCRMVYADQIVKEEEKGEKVYQVGYGFCSVRLPGEKEALTLVVIRGFGEDPVMLLTNVEVSGSRKSVWFVVRAYLQRWLVEDVIRFLKQSYRLEDMRVMKYVRLKNLISLVLAAAYFSAVWLGHRLRLAVLTSHIIEASQRFFGVGEFRYYALVDGIARLLSRFGFRWQPKVSRPVQSPNRQLYLPGFA